MKAEPIDGRYARLLLHVRMWSGEVVETDDHLPVTFRRELLRTPYYYR